MYICTGSKPYALLMCGCDDNKLLLGCIHVQCCVHLDECKMIHFIGIRNVWNVLGLTKTTNCRKT